jgi:hypothetical protein
MIQYEIMGMWRFVQVRKIKNKSIEAFGTHTFSTQNEIGSRELNLKKMTNRCCKVS